MIPSRVNQDLWAYTKACNVRKGLFHLQPWSRLFISQHSLDILRMQLLMIEYMTCGVYNIRTPWSPMILVTSRNADWLMRFTAYIDPAAQFYFGALTFYPQQSWLPGTNHVSPRLCFPPMLYHFNLTPISSYTKVGPASILQLSNSVTICISTA